LSDKGKGRKPPLLSIITGIEQDHQVKTPTGLHFLKVDLSFPAFMLLLQTPFLPTLSPLADNKKVEAKKKSSMMLLVSPSIVMFNKV
jgi:hypothetical protein